MSPQALAYALTKLGIAFPRQAITPELAEVYGEALSELSDDELEHARLAWTRGGNRFPYASELRELGIESRARVLEQEAQEHERAKRGELPTQGANAYDAACCSLLRRLIQAGKDGKQAVLEAELQSLTLPEDPDWCRLVVGMLAESSP